MLVLEDGGVVVYDIFGAVVLQFNLLPAVAGNIRVEDCQIWGAGLVALTSNMNIWAVDNLNVEDPMPYEMETQLNENHPITSMAVLQPQFTSSGNVEVILGTQENTVLVVDVNGSEDQLLHERIQAPVTKMAVAPNGRFLACFTENGMVTVISTSFTTKARTTLHTR